MANMSLSERPYFNQFNTPWTAPAIALLRELWLSGVSQEKIGQILFVELGGHWGQQAIGRKAERLKLPPRLAAGCWTDPMTEYLRELWASGTRISIIAELIEGKFGRRITRGAVVGRANRLKLPRHALANHVYATALERIAARKESRKKAEINRGSRRKATANWPLRDAAPIIEDFAIPIPQRKTLLALDKHDCRWPVGEPQSDSFFFCGAASENDKPYCPAHCKRAYVETRRY